MFKRLSWCYCPYLIWLLFKKPSGVIEQFSSARFAVARYNQPGVGILFLYFCHCLRPFGYIGIFYIALSSPDFFYQAASKHDLFLRKIADDIVLGMSLSQKLRQNLLVADR